jgi:hypothetical protein
LFFPRFSTCVSALPAADLAAFENRLSLNTFAAAFAAFLPVVPPRACASALPAADFAAFDLLFAKVFPALEAALPLVRSDITNVLLLSSQHQIHTTVFLITYLD